jgi:hypothetical protein
MVASACDSHRKLIHVFYGLLFYKNFCSDCAARVQNKLLHERNRFERHEHDKDAGLACDYILRLEKILHDLSASIVLLPDAAPDVNYTIRQCGRCVAVVS